MILTWITIDSSWKHVLWLYSYSQNYLLHNLISFFMFVKQFIEKIIVDQQVLEQKVNRNLLLIFPVYSSLYYSLTVIGSKITPAHESAEIHYSKAPCVFAVLTLYSLCPHIEDIPHMFLTLSKFIHLSKFLSRSTFKWILSNLPSKLSNTVLQKPLHQRYNFIILWFDSQVCSPLTSSDSGKPVLLVLDHPWLVLHPAHNKPLKTNC